MGVDRPGWGRVGALEVVMKKLFLGLVLLFPAAAMAAELDMLPLGDADLAMRLGSAPAGSVVDTAADAVVDIDELVRRLAEVHVVLLGEEHTAMDQKLFHARLVDALAATGRPVVLAMEFFQRDDRDALDRWRRGEIDDRELLVESGWYDRGGYRWEYYRPVMEVARRHGMPIVGVNVPRDIPRAVNRSGLDGLSEEQRLEIGEVTTDGSPEHRYLISRYFGDTVAMLPPGWFDNMYAAQCLWDVVMARSVLAEVADDTTVVLVVGSGHVAYGLGIPRRLDAEPVPQGVATLRVATFCPVTAPAPDPDGEPSGHPMGGDREAGGDASAPAQFARSLADYVGAFPDRGGIEAFPTLGLRLKADDEGRPAVSMVWPDTVAEAVGFASGDLILDVNGVEPTDLGELRFLIAELEWGDRVGVRVRRGDDETEVAALLFPVIETSERSLAPGYEVEPVAGFDPTAPASASDSVVPADRARWSLVTEEGTAARIEVHREDVLEEVHLLDEHGRVSRSLYRVARDNGIVEVRYQRDDSGTVVGSAGFDRSGAEID
jgi:uncharacterized iron-regulated protein